MSGCGGSQSATTTKASPAAFVDGPRSADQIQTALNGSQDFQDMTCRYHEPVIRCGGYSRLQKSDTYLAATVTVHKTAPRRGYAVTCVTRLGVCRRETMTFSH